MNHHLPALPHGQQPVPPPRRQHEMHYASTPPNIRSPPAYIGYPSMPQHVNGHGPPPYTQYPPWCQPYPHLAAAAAAAAAPPRPYPPHTPLIVSSYSPRMQTQPVIAPANVPPPPAVPFQSRSARSTNRPSSPAGLSPSQAEVREQRPVTPRTSIANPTPPLMSEPVKNVPATRDVFRAPVSEK
jgi:ubiquitin carboxyl-terminal hydrolase 10